ncbi:hypothetical protein P20429_1445 [Pseudoalteromonas sp. BSi20429]|nr:hypothetical protein P20429_1445 [Pseudoalteromonas sp. BSi20429]
MLEQAKQLSNNVKNFMQQILHEIFMSNSHFITTTINITLIK